MLLHLEIFDAINFVRKVFSLNFIVFLGFKHLMQELKLSNIIFDDALSVITLWCVLGVVEPDTRSKMAGLGPSSCDLSSCLCAYNEVGRRVLVYIS